MSKIVGFCVLIIIVFFNLFLGCTIYNSVIGMWQLDFLRQLSFLQFWGMSVVIGIFTIPTYVRFEMTKEDNDNGSLEFSLVAGLATSAALCLTWIISLIITTILFV